MNRKNPIRAPLVMTLFPDNPRQNALVEIQDVGAFALVDGGWQGTDGADQAVPYAAGVAAQRAVVISGGVATLCNRAVHGRCDGVVRAIVGGLAVVRREGPVLGFDQVADGQAAGVGDQPGSIVAPPYTPGRMIHVGYGAGGGVFMVRLHRPVVI